jgi:ACS family glucarate transporter-like MFS transporter
MSPVKMGWLFSAFAWAYVLGQVPAGWIADRISAKTAMMAGLVLWSCVTFFMGAAAHTAAPFISLMILRFMLGLFESPVGPASGRVIANWFPSRERGTAGSIFNSAQYLSLFLFTPLMAWINYKFGWEHIFTVMGGVGLMAAVLWWRTFHTPVDHPKLSAAELDYIEEGGALVGRRPAGGERNKVRFSEIMGLFKSRMLVGIFIAQYCINGLTWFFVSWFPTYLVTDRGFSILNAGFAASLPAMFGCIGAYSSGFFSDTIFRRTGSLSLGRKIPITIGLLLSTSIILCNYVDSENVVIALMCVALFGKGFGSLGWAIIADTAPVRTIGITGGVFNSLGNIAGIVTPIVIGHLVASKGNFEWALVYVGLHGLVAIASYWIIVGPLRRLPD